VCPFLDLGFPVDPPSGFSMFLAMSRQCRRRGPAKSSDPETIVAVGTSDCAVSLSVEECDDSDDLKGLRELEDSANDAPVSVLLPVALSSALPSQPLLDGCSIAFLNLKPP
jgi:hypothetical protein